MPHSPKHVLVIARGWPQPNAGDHVLQVLERLQAHGWRVTFASPAAAPAQPSGFTEQAVAADDSFAGVVGSLAPDMVLFEHFSLEEQFGWRVEQHCPDALRVLDVGALQSLSEARQVLLRQRLTFGLDPNDFRALFATSGPDLYRQMAPAETTLRELAAILRSDLSLVASDAEIDLLVNGFAVPPDLLHECPPMLEPRDAMPRAFSERTHVASLVDFRHAHDWDAVMWMKHNLWPMVRRRLPDAQLHIHGPDLPAKARALHDPEGGFLVLEHSADALAVLGQARVCLAPLRAGSGVNGALASALLAGTPAVTTPIGAEALHGGLPWPGLVSATAEGLAQAVATLYNDETRWNQARDDARRLLGARFDPRRNGQALLQRLEHTLTDLPAQRLYNFTGAMLRYRQRPH